jgi:hypothetical protein
MMYTKYLRDSLKAAGAEQVSSPQGRVERRRAPTGQSCWPLADANLGRRQRH